MIASNISSGILREAHARHSEIIFLQGDMLNLPFAGAKLAGIVDFYSIIHFDGNEVARAFAEMSRALKRGGSVLLGVHVGREVVHVDDLWGNPRGL